MQRVATARGVCLDQVGCGQIGLECAGVDQRKRVHPAFHGGPLVQATVRAEHLLHHRHGGARQDKHEALVSNPVLPHGRHDVGEA
jgi:hypothetical protein